MPWYGINWLIYKPVICVWGTKRMQESRRQWQNYRSPRTIRQPIQSPGRCSEFQPMRCLPPTQVLSCNTHVCMPQSPVTKASRAPALPFFSQQEWSGKFVYHFPALVGQLLLLQEWYFDIFNCMQWHIFIFHICCIWDFCCRWFYTNTFLVLKQENVTSYFFRFLYQNLCYSHFRRALYIGHAKQPTLSLFKEVLISWVNFVVELKKKKTLLKSPGFFK